MVISTRPGKRLHNYGKYGDLLEKYGKYGDGIL